MKVAICALALGTLLSGVVHAGPCTTLATATLENFQSCPKNVRQDIWLNQAKLPTIQDIGNKIYIVDQMGSNLASTTEWGQVYHLTIKDNQLCVTEACTHITEYSVAERGVFGLLTKKYEDVCNKRENYRLDRIRNWNGTLIQESGDFDLRLSKAVYPMTASEGSAILADSKSYFWQKTNALASVIKDLATPAQATLVIDFISDAEIRASTDLPGLFKKLITLKDERTNDVLLDLLHDGIIQTETKSELLQAASTENMANPELLEFVRTELSAAKCDGALNDSLIPYAKNAHPGVRNALVGLLAKCASYTKDAYYLWYDPAMKTIALNKTISGTLPIMELLENYKDSQTNINDDFKNMLITAINALSVLQSERALITLRDPAYFDSKYTDIAQATRKAVKSIEAAAEIKKIAIGDLAAIQWGFDLISFHNGSAKDLQMLVLDAFKKAMKLSPTIKTKIRIFIKNEIAQGYHAYDQELVDKMQSLLAT